MKKKRQRIVVLLFACIAATLAAEQRIIQNTDFAGLQGEPTSTYWRNSETGWFVQEFNSKRRMRPNGLYEERETKIAVLVDPYTGKYTELGQWDKIDEVFFPSGNKYPVICASDWGGTITSDGRVLESALPAIEPFHYIQFGSRTFGPFIYDHEFFRLSRDGSSIAIFASLPDSTLPTGTTVREKDVSRWVFHDGKAYGPYSRDAVTHLIVSLGGEHLAYSIDRTAEDGLYLDGRLVTAHLAGTSFGFIPVADAPYPEPCYHDQINNRRTQTRDYGTGKSGYRFLSGDGYRQASLDPNAGEDLYYIEDTPRGQVLTWRDGTIGPYKKMEVLPLVKGTANPPFIVKAWTEDDAGIVKIGAFESKPFPKNPYLITARWSAGNWFAVADSSKGTLYHGEEKISSFSGNCALLWLHVLSDGSSVMNVDSKKMALIQNGKTLGTYDALCGPILSETGSNYVAFGFIGTASNRKMEFFRNGKKYGPFPDTPVFLAAPSYAMTPDGSKTAFVTYTEKKYGGYLVHQYASAEKSATLGPYDGILFGTVRYLEGNVLSFITVDAGKKGEDRMCVVVDGKKFGPYPDFDYADLHYRQSERKFDLLVFKDGRTALIEESY